MCIKIPIAGCSGAGKTFTSKKIEEMLKKDGYNVIRIDLDEVVHMLYTKERVVEKVCSLFEKDLRQEDGSLDRRIMRTVLAENPILVTQLESLMMPEIEKSVKKIFEKNSESVILVDGIKVYKLKQVWENAALRLFITATEEFRLKNFQKRTGLTREEFDKINSLGRSVENTVRESTQGVEWVEFNECQAQNDEKILKLYEKITKEIDKSLNQEKESRAAYL